jgi:hypothetical protein
MLTKAILLTLLACTGSVFAFVINPIDTVFSVCQGKKEKAPCVVANKVKGTCQTVHDDTVSLFRLPVSIVLHKQLG